MNNGDMVIGAGTPAMGLDEEKAKDLAHLENVDQRIAEVIRDIESGSPHEMQLRCSLSAYKGYRQRLFQKMVTKYAVNE